MPQFDPEKSAKVIEKYLGKPLGRVLIRLTIVAGLLGITGLGLTWFFKDFIAELLWPFFFKLFGAGDVGISLDNIEAIIITLVAAIVVLVLIFLIFAIGMWKAFRRRVVPQYAIDELAELRSEGIKILNTLPKKEDIPSDEDQLEKWTKDWADNWQTRWRLWVEKVLETLDRNFTKAEKLSFQRLGVFPERNLGFAVNPEHYQYLMQLAQQLTILENLIQRHLERR